MKVLTPTLLTTAQLVAPSGAETDQPEWAAGTTYALNALVLRSPSHRIWQCVKAGSKGVDPTTAGQTDWIDTGPTNRWAMFDQGVGTKTVGTGKIDVTLAPGAVNALAVLDTNAESVRVWMKSGSTTLYDVTKTTNVSGGVIADWYAYFTDPIGKVMTLLFVDLPLFANAQIEVILTGPDPQGPVNAGTLLTGFITDLGSTEIAPTIGINDYSRKTTDDFGVTTVVQRSWSKQMTAKAMVDTSAADGLQRTLAGLRATPALWIAEEGYDSLTIYGFFKDFSIELALANISYVSITIEGLI